MSELSSDCSDGHQSADNACSTMRGNADGEFVGFPSTSDSDDNSEGDDSDVSESFRDTRLDTPAVGIPTTPSPAKVGRYFYKRSVLRSYEKRETT